MAEILSIKTGDLLVSQKHVEEDLSIRILRELKMDAHKQKAHREIDNFLSDSRTAYIVSTLLESLRDQPDDPFKAMALRLAQQKAVENYNPTVLATETKDILQRNAYFQHMHPQIFERVIASLTSQNFDPNTVIAQQNEAATCAYVICEGSVIINEQEIISGHVISLYGLQAQDSKHPFSISSGSNGAKLQVISRDQSLQFIYESQIKQRSQCADVFHTSVKNAFPVLTDTEIHLLANISRPFCLDRDETLCQQNDQLEKIFVITNTFYQQDIQNLVKQMTSNGIELVTEAPPNKPEYLIVGDVIGAAGVLIGKQEKATKIAGGVVEGREIEGSELKKRLELLKKMVTEIK